MQTKRIATIVMVVVALTLFLATSFTTAGPQGRLTADNPTPPASTVKLIFIHHSTGENWLADWDGGLGIALRDNNYFVSDTNYGWGPDGIGDNTDIGHWWDWFRGTSSAAYLSALYAESGQHSSYSRLATDPGGENEIIMFKSCFPNSHLGGSPGDDATIGENTLRGQDAWAGDDIHNVANAKGIYNDILEYYFATRQDKLFVLIVSPPLVASDTDAAHATNARALANWLDGYSHNNVAVFDFYNVLTSNGGNANTNDLDSETGNHHRWWSSEVQHIQTVSNNYSAYGSGDSHPTAAGNLKATAEFVQLLNVFYNRWAGGAVTPTPTATGPPSTATPTATATATGTVPPSTATATASPSPTVTPTPTSTPTSGPVPPQPTGLTAFHRSGQTFLTWNEVTSIVGEGYHVYRHTAPITAANIAEATRLTDTWGPLPEGSSIFYTDRDRGSGGSTYPGLDNYVITDLGPQLADTTSLFVWTSKETGDFYYAVTTVQDDAENRSDFAAGNALASPVTETDADPEPVLVWQSPSGNGRVYTQFMDFETFNPTFERPAAGLQYAYNYFVGLPTPEMCGGSLPAEPPLYLYLEGYGERYGVSDASTWGWCAIAVNGDDPNQSWYYGFSSTYDYRSGGTPDNGPIVNYSEERLLRAIYDTIRNPDTNVDTDRIYVYGHSMGGSGALALGMRYPNLFAASYSSEPMTDYATSGWDEDLVPKWGSQSLNLPIENRGRYAAHLAAYNGDGVYDWQNHQANLANRAGDEMAYITLAHGTLDDVIAWDTQGQPVYGQFYAGRRAFAGATVVDGHSWLGFVGTGPNLVWDTMSFRRDETIPGLSNGSDSLPVPPTGPGGYNQTLLWSSSWNPWDGPPVDQTDHWQISLCSVSWDGWDYGVCGTGAAQTVDVTPRRLQSFNGVPGASYTWENRRVSDDGLVDSGAITADVNGLVTVPDFVVSPGGNRLVLRPAGGPPTSTSTSTPTATADGATTTPTATATATATPTPTGTPPTGQQTMTFQDGVSPDASYAGTTDVILANDENNVASNANLGGLENLETFFGEGEEHRRSLMRWDLSALPGDAIIVSATVELYRYDGSAENAMQIALYRLTRDWAEGTGWDFWPDPSYVPDGATWTLASPGTAWTTPGSDLDATVVGQVTLPAGMANGWVSLDATAAVRAWIEDGLPNYGLLIRPLNGDYTYHYYYSRNHGTPNQRPRLVVTYTVGGAVTPTPTPTATSTPTPTPTNPPCDLDGDLDGDGDVDIADIMLVASIWHTAEGDPDYNPAYDLDGNGVIDIVDIMLVAIHWGENCTGSTPTPTPTATLTLATTPTPTPTPTIVIPAGLIQPADLVYQGVFRLPDGPPEIGWEWSGTAMAYYPDGDPSGPADGYPGSIFGTGHNWNQYVSEISIPVPVNSPSKDVNQLNTATTLQEFQNIRGSLFDHLDGDLRAGLAYLPKQGEQSTDKLYFAWGQHYQYEPVTSHGWSELDLSNPQPAGAWRIDDQPNYVTNDYLFAIPQAWADANTPGMYLATGRYRDGGQGARGPSLFAYGPWNDGNPPAPGSLLSTVPLLLYSDVTSPDDYTLNNYHHSDEWAGGDWLTASNKAAVIFVGAKGTGDCWYGCADGSVWEPPYPPDCPERGWWSSGFVGQILFYDPADLAAVARGEMETWQPQPYATLNIDQYLYHVESSQQKEHVGAASFDRQRGLLYVFEPLADEDKSLIHVWRIAG